MSLDIVYRCPVDGRELPPFGSFVGPDERRICDCHREPVVVEAKERGLSHEFAVAEDGTVEEHIGGAS